MLIIRPFFAVILWVLGLWWCSATVMGQTEIALLSGPELSSSALEATEAHPFDFSRKQIYFGAELDGRPVNFILDTGMPGLLLNNRGRETGADAGAEFSGEALGGAVRMSVRKVSSLRMAGREHGRQWAHTLDLRAVESRTERPVDGYVGYELLRNTELRIDYARQTFQLLRPTRRPEHAGRTPLHVLKFEFIGHLPVVTLRVGKHRLRFAIDTGASVNLLDSGSGVDVDPTNQRVNLQGLDGASDDCSYVLLPPVRDLDLSDAQRSFVSLDLSHLQTPGTPPIHGILGSDFLAAYTVGVDYRRRRVLLW